MDVVDVLVGGDLGLGERDRVVVAAGRADERSQLLLDRAVADHRHVGDLVLAVDVDAADPRVAAERLLDDPGAALAGEPPGRDGERRLGAGSLLAWTMDAMTLVVVVRVRRVDLLSAGESPKGCSAGSAARSAMRRCLQ